MMKSLPKSAEELLKKKKRKSRGDCLGLEPDSEFPVHEKYVKEEPVKE